MDKAIYQRLAWVLRPTQLPRKLKSRYSNNRLRAGMRRAQASAIAKDWDRAIAHWRSVVEMKGVRVPAKAFLGLARAYSRKGEVERSEAVLREGLEHHKSHMELMIQYAETAASLERWPTAVERWEAVIGRHGSVAPLEAYLRLSEAFVRCGEHGEAKTIVEKVLSLNPKDTRLLKVLEKHKMRASNDTGCDREGLPTRVTVEELHKGKANDGVFRGGVENSRGTCFRFFEKRIKRSSKELHLLSRIHHERVSQDPFLNVLGITALSKTTAAVYMEYLPGAGGGVFLSFRSIVSMKLLVVSQPIFVRGYGGSIDTLTLSVNEPMKHVRCLASCHYLGLYKRKSRALEVARLMRFKSLR